MNLKDFGLETSWGGQGCLDIFRKQANFSSRWLPLATRHLLAVFSVTGLRAFPGVLAYNMSKAALDQLTRYKQTFTVPFYPCLGFSRFQPQNYS